MRHKLLVIDDEESILVMLKTNLEAEGYEVVTAQSADEALNTLHHTPDLILLDINMPGMSGLELCGLIRAHVRCPILFLTARVTEQDVVNGLMCGGDDYITKPFHMEELLARIAAHLRREQRALSAPDVRFSDRLALDYNSRKVFWGDTPIDFSNKEFEIIRFLSMNAGIVFDRETIYERLWGYDSEGDSIVVKEHIRKIRNKLSVYTDQPFIETVWGVGYRWKR